MLIKQTGTQVDKLKFSIQFECLLCFKIELTDVLQYILLEQCAFGDDATFETFEFSE